MLKIIRERQARNLLPKRNADSHKGQNGRVLIVGGSVDYHGAPILSALGALNSGADLVYMYVPECNFEATRGMYPDFIVRKYSGEYLNEKAVKDIVALGKKCDSLLIGPGMGDHEESRKAALEIVKSLSIPTVLDAEAIYILKKIQKFPLEQTIVITPHKGEFQELVDKEIDVKENDPKSLIYLRSLAMDLHINVLLKGRIDFISSDEGLVEMNFSGNQGMTVGGSGDVLAGVVASMLAQGLDGFDASRVAAYFNGKAGDMLKKQKGFNFSASDIAMTLAYALA